MKGVKRINKALLSFTNTLKTLELGIKEVDAERNAMLAVIKKYHEGE